MPLLLLQRLFCMISPTSDAVMGSLASVRWFAAPGFYRNRPSRIPNLLMQGNGVQSPEEKHELIKLLRNLNLNGEAGFEPYTPTAQSSVPMSAADGFYSPELRGEFGAGFLDLHAMDDIELLLEVYGSYWANGRLPMVAPFPPSFPT